MDVQGHRGARGHLPENTLPAFAKALELGVTTLELDCGVTQDGAVVIHHDRRLNPDTARGPDGKWVQAPAPAIHSLAYEELRHYDVGRIRPGSEYAKRFPAQTAVDGARIPRLDQLFALVHKNRNATVRFNIETKISADAPQDTLPPEPFAAALIAEIRKAGVAPRTTVQSFDWRTLKVVEREAPEIATVYLTEAKDSDPARVHAAGGRIWSPDFRALSENTIAQAKAMKIKIITWTVNQPADIARMIDWQVDGIISDYPDRVFACLRSPKRC